MAELKTTPTGVSVAKFLNAVENDRRRADAKKVAKMMREVTGERPRMWGPSIVGYGKYDYRYETGRTGEWMATGFSPRKSALTLYIMTGFRGYDALMKKLGKYKTGKSCLYINKLEDVDFDVLTDLVRRSYEARKMGEA